MNANSKIKDYKIIECNASMLQYSIQQEISKGWKPFGPPFFVERGSDKFTTWVVGFQAMVIYEDQNCCCKSS